MRTPATTGASAASLPERFGAGRRPRLARFLYRRHNLIEIERLANNFVHHFRIAHDLSRARRVHARQHEWPATQRLGVAQKVQIRPRTIVRRHEIVHDDIRLVLLDEVDEVKIAASYVVNVSRDSYEPGLLE